MFFYDFFHILTLYSILYERKWLGSVKHGDFYIFTLCTAGIMYCFEDERSHMSPMLGWVINKIIPRPTAEQRKKQLAQEALELEQKQKEANNLQQLS